MPLLASRCISARRIWSRTQVETTFEGRPFYRSYGYGFHGLEVSLSPFTSLPDHSCSDPDRQRHAQGELASTYPYWIHPTWQPCNATGHISTDSMHQTYVPYVSPTVFLTHIPTTTIHNLHLQTATAHVIHLASDACPHLETLVMDHISLSQDSPLPFKFHAGHTSRLR
jgi:hypothetical protein